MKTIALCNQKGGVGKSTTTYHLAWAAARLGLRTLVIDADPQGNITSSLAAIVTEGAEGLADVLSSRVPTTMNDVIVAGLWENVEIVPTTGESLASVRDELVIAGAGRESRLKEAIATLKDRFDLVLIDCPPSLDQLTANALTAANTVLIVSHAKKWSADGLAALLTTIGLVCSHYNPNLSIEGILINQYEARTTSGAYWADEVGTFAEQSGIPLVHNIIPKRVLIAECVEASTSLDEWNTPTATEIGNLYLKIAKEITQ